MTTSNKIILLSSAISASAFCAWAQTNFLETTNMPDANANTLNQLVDWNNRLLGLPSGVLVLVVMFLFNKVLYYAEFFRNRNIPVFSIVGGTLLYFLLSWHVGEKAFPTPIWQTKNIIIGAIIGCVAWIASLRYFPNLIPSMAGKADPSAPLPEPPPANPPTRIEVDLVNKPADKPEK